jgi:restriction system protein
VATSQETLFQVLLRKPWWFSLIVTAALFGITHFIFPPVAPFMALPFGLLTLYIAFRQATGSAPLNVPAKLAVLRALSWDEFSSQLVKGYEKLGYVVEAAKESDFDFRLTKDGRVTLLQCRRWKAGETGIGPIRALDGALKRHDAYKAISVSAAVFTPAAYQYVAGKPILLLGGFDLLRTLSGKPL